jgi:hypothetical protein
MRTKILEGGKKRVIYVLSKSIKLRFEQNQNRPLVAVRCYDNINRLYIYRKVDILGPSTIMEIDEALPGSNGRGICPLVTEAPLRVHMDDKND